MNNILGINFPSPKNISPASLKDNNVLNTPEPNYLNRKYNWAIAPKHYNIKNKFLFPSPKNNLDQNPTCLKSPCIPNQPFKKNKCYTLYSPQQNIWGKVCGSSGSNANWVRGNQFSLSYDRKKLYNKPLWAVDVPKFFKPNPVLVSNSNFYPFPDYNNRFLPEYKSYPYQNKYINGKPIINYPYTLFNTNENFTNKSSMNANYTIITLLALSLILLGLYQCTK